MIKYYFSWIICFSVLSCVCLTGCLKDHCTHSTRYTLYQPAYTSINDIRASVKSEEPRALKHTGKIFYHNGYLFLNELNEGVHIIDNRNPSAPKNIAFIHIPGNVDVAAVGNTLYADSYIDLLAIDISNPLSVKVTRRVKNIFPDRYYAYGIADGHRGDSVITGVITKDTVIENDCNIQLNEAGYVYDSQAGYVLTTSSNKASAPSVTPTAASLGGSMTRFATYKNYLYTVQANELGLFDISRPAMPDSINKINLQQAVETIFPYDHYLFIGAPTGIMIYNVANPSQPSDVIRFAHYFACDPVVVQNGYAYITLRSGAICGSAPLNELDVVNIKDLHNIKTQNVVPLSSPYGLSIDGHRLIVCDGAAGIRFMNIPDLNDPKPEIVKTIGNIEAYDAIAINGLLIVTAKEGIYQYDYNNYSNPKLLSKINTD